MAYTSVPTDRVVGGPVSPSDHNIIAGYIERGLARVLLRLLIEEGIINRDPDTPTVDETTARITAPTAGDPLVGVINGNLFYMGNTHELSATTTGGGTTYLVSSSLTQADNYWLDAWVVFTSGAHAGTAVQVTASDQSEGRLTWTTDLGSAVASGTTFVVTFYYVQDLTAGALNYVFGRVTGRTTEDGLIEFVASTSSTPAAGDILLASVTLDVGGNVIATNNAPSGHDRNLWTGAGAVHQVAFSGTLTGLLPGAYTDVTIAHAAMLLLGPVDVSLGDADCSYEVTEAYRPDRIILRVTNNGSYATNVTYTGTRWGRKKIYL